MRGCLKTLGGLVLAGAVLSGAVLGCRSRKPAVSDAARGIGFQVEDEGRIVRGAILTDPTGREEAVLPFIAGGIPGWTKACHPDTSRGAVTFKLKTDSSGHVSAPAAAAPPGPEQAGACLVRQAAAAAAAAKVPLVRDTEIAIQLVGP